MSEIKFIDSLNEYVNNRATKIQAKKKDIQALRSQLQTKNEEIKLQEQQYKLNFDEEIFNKLISTRNEADKISNDIKNISKIIDLMDASGAFQYDDKTLEKEIHDYVERLNIPLLRSNIEATKAAYLKALEDHTNVMEQLSSTRNDLEQIRGTISQENKTTIHKTFYSHSNSLYWDFDNLQIDGAHVQSIGHRNHSYAVDACSDFRREV